MRPCSIIFRTLYMYVRLLCHTNLYCQCTYKFFTSVPLYYICHHSFIQLLIYSLSHLSLSVNQYLYFFIYSESVQHPYSRYSSLVV